VGVDPQSRNAILERVVSLKDEGCTVIYTSHYMDEVERVCDRIAIVDHGKLLTAGSVGEIIAKHGGDQKVIATGEQGEESFSMADPSSAIRSIARVQGLKGFQTQHPSLETVFLNLTGRSLKDK